MSRHILDVQLHIQSREQLAWRIPGQNHRWRTYGDTSAKIPCNFLVEPPRGVQPRLFTPAVFFEGSSGANHAGISRRITRDRAHDVEPSHGTRGLQISLSVRSLPHGEPHRRRSILWTGQCVGNCQYVGFTRRWRRDLTQARTKSSQPRAASEDQRRAFTGERSTLVSVQRTRIFRLSTACTGAASPAIKCLIALSTSRCCATGVLPLKSSCATSNVK